MTYVVLANPDLSLYSDPVNTRVSLPYVTARTIKTDLTIATQHFDGYDAPLAFRTPQWDQQWALTITWPRADEAGYQACLALLQQARTSADGRLQLRMSGTTTPGLTPVSAVVIQEWNEDRGTFGSSILTCTTQMVYYNEAV